VGQSALAKFGIAVEQVGIKRIAYPEENIATVLPQMRAERRAEAGKLRAEGERDTLRAALVCVHASRHPDSRAIVQAAQRANIQPNGHPGAVEEVAGQGILAADGDGRWLLGRRQWLLDQGIPVPEGPSHGGSVVWLGRREGGRQGAGEAFGCFLLADRIRPEARRTLDDLRAWGLTRSVLLTGDRKQVAEQIGRDLTVDRIVAEVLPEEKLEVVRMEREAGHLVMVVGDGVNDALAMSRSDVGIALGAAASDVALRSADVALLVDDLGRLPSAWPGGRGPRSTTTCCWGPACRSCSSGWPRWASWPRCWPPCCTTWARCW
jgi:cation transport ATPase